MALESTGVPRIEVTSRVDAISAANLGEGCIELDRLGIVEECSSAVSWVVASIEETGGT